MSAFVSEGKYDSPDANVTASLIVPDGAGRVVQLGGQRITVKLPSALTGGALSVSDVEVPVHGGVPLHVHSLEDEFFYVLEGRFEMRIGDVTCEAGPGDFAIGVRGIPHSWRCIGPEKGRLLAIHSPADNFASFAREVSERGLNPINPTDAAEVTAIGERHGVQTLSL